MGLVQITSLFALALAGVQALSVLGSTGDLSIVNKVISPDGFSRAYVAYMYI